MKRLLKFVSVGTKSQMNKHSGFCIGLVIAGVGVGVFLKEIHPFGWGFILTASAVMWGLVFTTR